ncbi:uncharacterized protein LOC131011927 [Salvia miltiorrhiza]|uniref:uncharacterized protein LOC131011927 n=1 Tax=Salvia miltiorrhiza TaxID=226208 RepID=UPI0025AB7314|nr:uncharacterized protein LOC131011927 [Salvia miltiorrhiza]
MSMATSSSITVFSAKPTSTRSWNPISRLAVSKCKNHELSFWARKKTLQYTRKSFVVSANTAPGVPPASGPPSSSKPMSWILGLVVSFILPFFTNKWGPLWVIKNKLENAVQTVEDIVEAVEKVAGSVDKIAEDIADDLPEGSKLRDLVEKVEHLAEKTAKTADSLDNVIDKVQEASDQVDDIVCATKEEKSSSEAAKNKND